MNIVVISGFLGADPIEKHTTRGTLYVTASLGVNEYTGKGSKIVQWTPLVFWKALAENVLKYCKKGTHMTVNGRLENFAMGEGSNRKKIIRVSVKAAEWQTKKDLKTTNSEEEALNADPEEE